MYKSIRLSINGTFATGAKAYERIPSPASYTSVYNSDLTYNESPQVFENDLFAHHLNVPKAAADRWTVANTNGSYPRVWNPYGESYGFSYYNPMDKEITWGAYLVNLSYVRIRNIILGYTLPNKLINKSALSNVDLSLSLNNFFTFTNYSGMDPETPGATYPISRSVMFSVNVGF